MSRHDPYQRYGRWKRCANCDAGLVWGRWCIDCVRMSAKVLGTAALAECGRRLVIALFFG